MGGVAQTMWSINPVRDQVSLFFTQALDSELWRPDSKTRTGGMKASPENFTVAARATAPRQQASAHLRRERLGASARGATTPKMARARTTAKKVCRKFRRAWRLDRNVQRG